MNGLLLFVTGVLALEGTYLLYLGCNDRDADSLLIGTVLLGAVPFLLAYLH